VHHAEIIPINGEAYFHMEAQECAAAKTKKSARPAAHRETRPFAFRHPAGLELLIDPNWSHREIYTLDIARPESNFRLSSPDLL